MTILGSILLASALAQAPAPEPPRLVFDAEGFNSGPVDQGGRISHEFVATNLGGAPLVIRQVRSSCGCTTVVVGDTILAPGARTAIKATLDTAGLAGHVRKTLEVQANDPRNPVRVLTFEADVAVPIEASSHQILFQDLTRNERRKFSVHLASTTGKPIVITDVVLSEAPWLGVATREAGTEAWVDLELAGSRLPAGRSRGVDTVAVQARNPGPSEVDLEVRWELRPMLVAEPARVAWSEPAGRALTQRVRIRRPDGKPFRILGAGTSLPGLAVGGLDRQAAPRHDLRITLAGSVPPGIYNGTVTLRTDAADQAELAIPVALALR